jgi:hypothetical protein
MRRYPSADRRSVRRTDGQLNSCTCPASDFIELDKRGLGFLSAGVTVIHIIIIIIIIIIILIEINL